MAYNPLLLEVYYLDELIEVKKLVIQSEGSLNYSILGNGNYSVVIKDLAGNIHEFDEDLEGNNLETVDKIEVYVLREVVLTVNGMAPVANAFYNGEVSVAIYGSSKYVTGSILVSALKNGSLYSPNGFNPYIFTEPGTYVVSVKAEYFDGEKKIPLENKIRFTIVNVKEARPSIDLTALSGTKIERVENQDGENITNAFLEMINKEQKGFNITYDGVMHESEKLNLTSGKQTFTIFYSYSDGIYPTRNMQLSFTLNNENPTISCTLEKGEKTTKGFEIFFNPAVIYEQVGEAYVVIGDEIVAYINENSVNEEVRIETTYKNNGDGDYYIQLISSSGVVLDSYKVTIKEPLNTGAIIVIVVVVGVILTIAITVIVLRRKMRIR